MKSIDEINFSGLNVLIRVDFNVPLSNTKEVTDNSRIVAALPTIKKVVKDGGKAIIASHLGRPKGVRNNEYSLQHIVPEVIKCLGQNVQFVSDCIGNDVENAVNQLNNGEVLLLENVRFYNEETDGDKSFAEKLSQNIDFYINDAFGTAHREHASTAVIARFFKGKAVFGYLMASEIQNVKRVLDSNEKPVTAIVGGAKVSSKIGIIENLLDRVNNILIGGGMAYTFAKAQGGEVGKSLVEDDCLELALSILSKAKDKGVIIYLPTDSVNALSFSNESETEETSIGSIPMEMMGLDIGQNSITEFSAVIENSKVILWNGPMGVFEMSNFSTGTVEVGNAIVKATKRGAFSLVGGGDSVAAAKQFDLAKDLSYISTGGGAMLEFLEGKVLPGIKAIEEAY
ncbi:MAG: phosphoglycerate kinase [Schleiferiaceae bacterium]|jgi:phosphoglycerate kinase|nr:phosphoglycerate kinase [Schleiferiaceae bacterium]